LESYFKKAGEIADFKTKYLLREISLLSFDDEIEIFTDSIKNENSEILSSGYILNSYTVERNFYRIKYDYYISFSKRSEEIKNEMRLTKSLSLVTLLIVFAVFFLTLRNLFIQKRLSELKSDFINNMTHELKTPLSTISVATSNLILNEGNLDKEQVIEISGIIKKQNKHLSNLIDKILDIGIWEKDQVRINTKPLNIWQLINEIANDFRTANPGVSFELKLDPPKIEKLFSIDEVHFTTVINNLLSNALKYGGDPPVIQLIVEYGNLLEIKVTDNGKGIPLSEQKQLFEKFFRGKDSTERAIRGLGLGLYYVRQIVQAHNGQVYLERSDENGSTFVISIMD
jgi:two-component system phosphate regulon sensor histidine kinase PhoR